MERPTLNPSVFDDDPAVEESRPLTQRLLELLITGLLFTPRLIRLIWRTAVFDLTRLVRLAPREDDSPLLNRAARFLILRALMLPFLIAGLIVPLTMLAAYPPRAQVASDPRSVGLFYQADFVLSRDGSRVGLWLVPAVDAEKVLAHRELAVSRRSPAVVLVHDSLHGPDQLLPLAQPLHDAGYTVLIVSLRGTNSASWTADTMGLRESDDVAAAVQYLRERPSIEADRIAVVGIGTGAVAALRASRTDPHLKSVILAAMPADSARDQLKSRLAPASMRIPLVGEVVALAWESTLRVDLDEVAPDRLRALAADPRVRALEVSPLRIDGTLLTLQILDAALKPAAAARAE